MTVRQADTPISDEQLKCAVVEGGTKRVLREIPVDQADMLACRLYPSLSFFFDGTDNNMERDRPLKKHTNIVKLHEVAKNSLREDAAATYVSGVGTPFRFTKVVGYTNHLKDDEGGALGLGFGAGGELRIKYAIGEFSRLLEVDWGPGSWQHMREITVAIFGFSRGATQARAFARQFIEQKCVKDGGKLFWQAPSGVRVPLRITFMGLFDTVASIGGPALHLGWASALAIPPEVERCVHYVSAHEVRQAFPLDSLRVDKTYPGNCEEVVYPGVHSDVGGGYAPGEQGRSQDLSLIPLRHMFAEAFSAGVSLYPLSQLQDDVVSDFELPDDAPVIKLFNDYMAALPPASGPDLEALIEAHRYLNFRWRGILARHNADERVLGHLHEEVDASFCAAVPAATDADHPPCPPGEWRYDVPKNPETQAGQLLGEQRRLAQHIKTLRNPVEQRPGDQSYPQTPRELNAYETLILSAWDEPGTIPLSVDELLAGYIHDSVAAFTSWPCALYDPRLVFCDKGQYWAINDPLALPDQVVA